ncbi:hypothetical protein [Acidithiobacillus thiooxidans]|uniref:Uncharacterized protein n=1 Tax=Acidithiobacillus thiooxidans ATCC 19377 TaxID=637390 RepID=A0A543Q2B1_ACITH|nr:hypothetical protein [Acidithiobacillus thiooxidans]MDX5935408.1 hypothetical protein [Acidithiobacillus thiooxidans]TQN50455.1 hypothetical protein DLNHIDIE_00308 [Acidithiobacillus thiooxidans ATCC 19377]
MSTTYTCKRQANVFLNKDGERIFIMNEVTYDSNVFPHTPGIHVFHIGDLKSTMEKIFSYAADVEGGMLVSPNGRLTPEGYIKSWIECIKRPYFYDPEQPLDFEFYRLYPDIKKGFIEAVEERGTPKTVLNHYDLAIKFHAYSSIPKTFSNDGCPYVGESTITGYMPDKCHETPPPHPTHFIRLDDKYEPYYIQMDENGVGISAPVWPYRAIGHYIASLYEQEFSHPGSYKACIASFRDFLKTLPETNPGNVLCVVKPIESSDDEYMAKRKRELIDEYGNGSFDLDSVPSDKRYFIFNGPVRFTLKNTSDWMAHSYGSRQPVQVQESLFL